jgi:ADP-ribose pyrophosphatase
MSSAESSELIGEGSFLRLCRRGGWEYVERVNATGVVAMLAITDDDEILFVEQFRPAVNARVLELPAGLVGDVEGDDSLETAANRELVEETGYRAARVEPLVSIPSSAGLTTETTVLFRCSELAKVGPGGGDDTEDITVLPVKRSEAGAWVARRIADGMLVDAKVFAGLYYAG